MLEKTYVSEFVAVQLLMCMYTAMFSGLMAFAECWSFGTALYFTVSTLSTVGYGDVVPTTDVGKTITTLFIACNYLIFALAVKWYHQYLQNLQTLQNLEPVAL